MTEQETQVQAAPEQAAPAAEVQYAGFWRRLAAFVIDYIVVLIAVMVLAFAYGFIHAMAVDGDVSEDTIRVVSTVLSVLVVWLYWAIMESSPEQATLGKMALGLKVTDMEGNRISFIKATARHFGKILSSLLLMFGYIMIAFTEKKQGLHDLLPGCLVVKRPRGQ